jgi:NADH/NAD ratio-sensing transcriptional regulator Rex
MPNSRYILRIKATLLVIAALRGHLESELRKRSRLSSAAEGAARVRIDVVNYRMRSGFARSMFGVMAGKDGVGSKVTVLGTSTDEVLGESEVSTFNVMAVGGEDDIARMHGVEIAKFLVGETKSTK